jgi:hypothetical protein
MELHGNEDGSNVIWTAPFPPVEKFLRYSGFLISTEDPVIKSTSNNNETNGGWVFFLSQNKYTFYYF